MTKFIGIVDVRIKHFENSLIPNLTKHLSVSELIISQKN